MWCDGTYEEIQVEPAMRQRSFVARSLQTLDHDLDRFTREGRGNIKVAKLYNNVIRERLFDVPLNQV